jgi:hypothetical protein
MVHGKLNHEDRLLRRRQAARVRQQRCRARKREALLEIKKIKEKQSNRSNQSLSMSPSQQNTCIPPPNEHTRSKGYMVEMWPSHIEKTRHQMFRLERHHPYSNEYLHTPRYDSPIRNRGPNFYSHNHLAECSQSSRFVSIEHHHHHYYSGKRAIFEFDRDQDFYSNQTWPTQHSSYTVLPSLVDENFKTMSPEEAAIDAILSLKSSPPDKDTSSSNSLKPLCQKELESADRRYLLHQSAVSTKFFNPVRILS